ncbi:MAG TPA: tetratricopeptide repeat protein, partial [Candidatus Binatia bacterium]|nr:tetratricopeptide repeat protein [Candidatus Binatia bacterium]
WVAAFAALSVAAGLVLLTQRPAGIVVPPLATRLTLPPRVAWFYVHQFLWPAELVPIYPRWPLHGFGASDALAWLAVGAVVAGAAVAWRRIPRAVLFGAAFFVANLSLVAGITWFSYYDYSLVADHFAYLPSLGLAFATLGWLATPTVAGRGPLVTAATVVLGVACVALGVRTFTQVPAWNDTQTLWKFTLARNPTCYQCEYNLALDLEEHGDAEHAASHYERALDLHPDAEAAINLGNIRVSQGRNDDAQALYRRAVELDPANPVGHYNLAMMLAAQGDLDGAVREDSAAIAIVPRHVGARLARGDALLRLDRAADAEKDFQAVLTTSPEDPDALTGLGRAAVARAAWPAALTSFEKALRRSPRADVHRMVAEVLEQLGREDDAVAHYRAAYEAEPGNADGATSLVTALLTSGRVAEAVALLQRRVADTPEEPAFATSLAWIEATARDAQWRNAAEAVRLAERACPADDCDDPDRLDTLAAAYAEAGRFDDAIRAAERAVTAARGTEDGADAMEERLALYRARQPYRSPW